MVFTLASQDFSINFIFIARWLHILSAILWLGLLFFINLVLAPAVQELPFSEKAVIYRRVSSSLYFWFRYSALATFLFGWLLLLYKYGHLGLWKDPVTDGLSERSWWIFYGAVLGTIMWFNVWFVIWPNHRIAMELLHQEKTFEELKPYWKTAQGASRVNLYLSGPMLLSMIASNNYFSINVLTWLLFNCLGLLAMALLHGLSKKLSKKAA